MKPEELKNLKVYRRHLYEDQVSYDFFMEDMYIFSVVPGHNPRYDVDHGRINDDVNERNL